MKKVKIEVYGGFHDQTNPKTIKVSAEIINNWDYYGWSGLLGSLSYGVRRSLERHMCGYSDCMCGSSHGWEWDEV